jgi:hypothetical protein
MKSSCHIQRCFDRNRENEVVLLVTVAILGFVPTEVYFNSD